MRSNRYRSRRHTYRKRSPFGGVVATPEEIRKLNEKIEKQEAAEFDAENFEAKFDDVWGEEGEIADEV